MACSCKPLFRCQNWLHTDYFHASANTSTRIYDSRGSSMPSTISSLYSHGRRRKFQQQKLDQQQVNAQAVNSTSLFEGKTPRSNLTPPPSPSLLLPGGGCGIGGDRGNNNGNAGNGWGWWWHEDDFSFRRYSSPLYFFCCAKGANRKVLLFIFSAVGCLCYVQTAQVLARTSDRNNTEEGSVWEVRGSKWTRLIPDFSNDAFIVVGEGSSSSLTSSASSPIASLCVFCRDLLARLMLPDGFPNSVTSDYLDYSLWRGVQGVASQISGVLATQSLLYAVGLGKGAIPTAAAVNWVLKDGIGYLSKILLSEYGRHFDVNPKGWRLFADVLENAAFGLEMLTPVFPHLFVPIGAAAGAGRSAAALIQAATRSCFYAGFAAQRNFAEVIAKGEAQGMVSKSIGIMLGIALANWIGSSAPLALASFGAVTWVHMFCNVKSYQSVQLRSLNPYRASLIFSEYLLSGQVPSIKEVNDEEPLFPAIRAFNSSFEYKGQSTVLSAEAKDAAAEIEHRLQLGSKLSSVVHSKEDVLALFDLYKDEGYILTDHMDRFCVILKESSSPLDMLKALFQVNYLYWLERNAGIEFGGKRGGRLQLSLDYVQREFNHARADSELVGWVTDGLIARPLPNRIRPGPVPTSPTS